MEGFYVEIVCNETGETIHTFGPHATETAAERVERGVTINLDHERCHTRIVTKPPNAALSCAGSETPANTES